MARRNYAARLLFFFGIIEAYSYHEGSYVDAGVLPLKSTQTFNDDDEHQERGLYSRVTPSSPKGKSRRRIDIEIDPAEKEMKKYKDARIHVLGEARSRTEAKRQRILRDDRSENGGTLLGTHEGFFM